MRPFGSQQGSRSFTLPSVSCVKPEPSALQRKMWKVVFSFDENANDPGRVLAAYIRQKLDHAFDKPEMSRIFTREVLDGGRNLERYWPNSRLSTQKKIDAINGWIARGLMRPLDALLLLQHIWAMTQFYADHADQVLYFRAITHVDEHEREHLINEVRAFIFKGAGVK